MLNFLQVRKTWIIGDSFYLCVFHLPLWICCTQIKELFKHCCKLNVDQSHEWKKDECNNIYMFLPNFIEIIWQKLYSDFSKDIEIFSCEMAWYKPV